MPLVNFFTSDPGLEIRTATTAINLIEKLAAAIRFAAGAGSVGYVAAVVNDRGVPNIPRQMSSPREFETLYGGFRSWLGDGLDSGTLAGDNYADRGAASGYNGNGYALAKGLDAPIVVLQPPDLAIKDVSISPGPATDLLVKFTRAVATYGAYQLPAGTRITDGDVSTPYVLATLEDVFWNTTETGDREVRVRQVSPSTTAPVALNLVDTFVDAPADVAVTIATTDVTEPDGMDATEVALRYEQALTKMLDNAPGRIAELIVSDRTESAIGDAVGNHCVAASSQGLFRLGVVAPPLGTTAEDARTDAAVGVIRTTLQRDYVSYCHPGWQRQFQTDSDNLNAEDSYAVTMASHVAWAYLTAQRRPEENPARPHPILTAYKAIGIESLALGQPDQAAHEQAGITQPLIDQEYLTGRLAATYHASPMANGTTKFATRRMAFFLYRNWIALAAPYHKAFASSSNQNGLLSAIDAFHQRLLAAGRIADATPTQGDWDPETSEFTVTAAVDEVGNLDVITLRPTFGPSAIEQADLGGQ